VYWYQYFIRATTRAVINICVLLVIS